jgi:hypothetical protein
MVRMHRPHFALQPRQRWTWVALRGAFVLSAWRT